MKKVVLLIILFASISTYAQSVQLSPKAKISIITCGPGQEEVFLAFGHSAIRIYDSLNRIDYAYNYGVFDFNQPNFYINYTKGLLLFKLGVYYYSDFLNAYLDNGRWVHEQVLNLTPRQTQKLFNYLETNALPQNQTYRYDYFYNNCSSKVRDVVADVLVDSIKFNDAHIKTNYTIRELTDIYLKQQPWGDLGIDICLGLPMDKKASPYEYMFLPDFLELGFDNAIVLRNNRWIPVVEAKYSFEPTKPQVISDSLIHPWVAFGAFFVIAAVLSVYDLRRKKLSKWFDTIFFCVTGLIGLLLILLWTATDHQAAAKNFNILWALPTNLLVWLIYRERSSSFLKKYFSVVTVIYALLALSWFFLPQQLHFFLLPLVAGLLLRSFTLSRLL
ncbi:DUF4105 domain-containing protein [soil metagenome]